MRMTRSYYRLSMMMVAMGMLLIPVFSGCKKSTPPAPNASTQNTAGTSGSTTAGSSGTTSGTTSGMNAGNSAGTASGSSSNAASNAGVAANNPAPPKPVKVTLTVASGKDVSVRINETINAKTANVGDPFTGVLSSPLTTKAGETVFAKNTRVSGTVVAAKGQGRFAGSGVLAIELKEVAGHSVAATEYVVSKKGKGKRSAALIGGGAGGGALIGALAGGGKGALIGGLIGGGAGTAGAGLTGNKPLVIPTESIVVFELTQPLSITVEK